MVSSTQAYLNGVAGQLVLAALVLWVALPARGEIYLWRDASGRVHFSDKKPAAVEAEAVSDRLSVVNTDQSASERKKLERLFKAETSAEKAHRQRQESRQQQAQAERQRQCDQARQQLSLLQGPVYFTRDDGSSYSISEAERERRASEMAEQLALHCRF